MQPALPAQLSIVERPEDEQRAWTKGDGWSLSAHRFTPGMPLDGDGDVALVLMSGEGLLAFDSHDRREELLEAGDHCVLAAGEHWGVELIGSTCHCLALYADHPLRPEVTRVRDGHELVNVDGAHTVLIYALSGERLHCQIDTHEIALVAGQLAQVAGPLEAPAQVSGGEALVIAISTRS